MCSFQGIKTCQDSLKRLSTVQCIMEIEMSPLRPRPYVLRHEAVTQAGLEG